MVSATEGEGAALPAGAVAEPAAVDEPLHAARTRLAATRTVRRDDERSWRGGMMCGVRRDGACGCTPAAATLWLHHVAAIRTHLGRKATAERASGYPRAMTTASERFLVPHGKPLDLAALDPRGTPGFDGDKEAGRARLARLNARLEELQETLYAQGQHRLLVVLQAMDAGGKDGTIRSVFEGVNPQGVKVACFKAPTPKEQAHDFLWRPLGKVLAKTRRCVWRIAGWHPSRRRVEAKCLAARAVCVAGSAFDSQF